MTASDTRIRSLQARRLWDSRGRPTLEAEVTLADGSTGRGIAPAGASRGSREAIERRDGGTRLGGLDVTRAVAGVQGEIARHLASRDALDQSAIDAALIALDGTPDKSRLGGNALVAVSLAVLHAGDVTLARRHVPRWHFLAAQHSRCKARLCASVALSHGPLVNGGAAGSSTACPPSAAA